MRQVVRAITAIAGLLFLAFGLWSFLSPRSFFRSVATFEPYNLHFLHDLGAFQIGIGATLLLALFRRDALFVALWGTAIGSAVHTVAHFIDRDLGGMASQPYLLTLLTALIAVAAVLHSNVLSRERQRRR